VVEEEVLVDILQLLHRLHRLQPVQIILHCSQTLFLFTHMTRVSNPVFQFSNESSVADPDPHHFVKLSPDPREKLNPDPHIIQKQNPEPNLHQFQNSEAAESQNGVLEGRRRSQWSRGGIFKSF